MGYKVVYTETGIRIFRFGMIYSYASIVLAIHMYWHPNDNIIFIVM